MCFNHFPKKIFQNWDKFFPQPSIFPNLVFNRRIFEKLPTCFNFYHRALRNHNVLKNVMLWNFLNYGLFWSFLVKNLCLKKINQQKNNCVKKITDNGFLY